MESGAVHGLRHRLAINTLVKRHRRRVDVKRHLPALSAYLGHAHITDTHLTAILQLLRYVLRRGEGSERRGRRAKEIANFPPCWRGASWIATVRRPQPRPPTIPRDPDTPPLLMRHVQRGP